MSLVQEIEGLVLHLAKALPYWNKGNEADLGS